MIYLEAGISEIISEMTMNGTWGLEQDVALMLMALMAIIGLIILFSPFIFMGYHLFKHRKALEPIKDKKTE